MINESEMSQANIKQKQFLIECNKCNRIFSCDSIEEVMFDDDTETTIIRISEDCTYCSKCISIQIQEQMQETRTLQQRFIYYKEFQSSFEEKELIKHQTNQNNNSIHLQEEQIKRLQKEEQMITQEFNKIKEESTQLKQRFYVLEVEEEKFWEGINKIQRRTSKVQQKSLNTKFDKQISKNTLQQLSKMSILHIFLDIKVDDSIAYVQGMAMGKKGQNFDISWEEVSIGLGHLIIGLHFLVIKYSYQYKKISEIILKGSQSQVILKGQKKVYSMLNNKQNQKTFGQLLQLLLFQTFYLCQHILESQSIQYSQQFKMPFIINQNDLKIGDLYIDPLKIDQRTRWATWTKAMRYFLIDFKHLATVYAINDKYL